MRTLSLYHWKVGGGLPEVPTLKVTGWNSPVVWFCGWLVMAAPTCAEETAVAEKLSIWHPVSGLGDPLSSAQTMYKGLPLAQEMFKVALSLPGLAEENSGILIQLFAAPVRL